MLLSMATKRTVRLYAQAPTHQGHGAAPLDRAEGAGVRRLEEVMRWLEQAPPETLMPARSVLALLRDAVPPGDAPNGASERPAATWRERLWTAPAETRLGVKELSEAIGRPPSWVYRHTSERSGLEPLPYKRLDGSLVFLAGEIRQWIADHEATVVPARSLAVPTLGTGRADSAPTSTKVK